MTQLTDTLSAILQFLPPDDMLRASLVCQKFYEISKTTSSETRAIEDFKRSGNVFKYCQAMFHQYHHIELYEIPDVSAHICKEAISFDIKKLGDDAFNLFKNLKINTGKFYLSNGLFGIIFILTHLNKRIAESVIALQSNEPLLGHVTYISENVDQYIQAQYAHELDWSNDLYILQFIERLFQKKDSRYKLATAAQLQVEHIVYIPAYRTRPQQTCTKRCKCLLFILCIVSVVEIVVFVSTSVIYK